MRYDREVRWRFHGPRDVCLQYIPQARKLLGELHRRDRELGDLNYTARRTVLPDGTVIELIDLDPIPIITIRVAPTSIPPGEPQYTAKLIWLPEGICFTPVSDLFPDGWGLPSRMFDTAEPVADERGTDGGRCPQVILNKKANNNYLDRQEYILVSDPSGGITTVALGVNLRLRSEVDDDFNSASTQYQTWHPLYQPLDCGIDPDNNGVNFWAESTSDLPGMYQGSSVAVSQFDTPLGNSLVYEPQASEWYTHRPEEALFYYPGYEGVFQHTNSLRANAGLERLFRPTRGRADISLISATEVQILGKQFHDHPDFRPGFRNPTSRGSAAQQVAAIAENLYFGPQSPSTLEEGEEVSQAWEASPPHHANQIHAIWDTENFGTEMFVASLPVTITESESGGVYPSPIPATEWAQMYALSQTWLPLPFQYHEGDIHVTGNYGKLHSHDRGDYYEDAGYFFVTWGQVVLAVPLDLTDERPYAVLGVAFYREAPEPDENGEIGELIPKLRCVIACGDRGVSEPDHDWYFDHDDFALTVITTELNVTGVSEVEGFDVAGACRWEIEDEYLFTLVDEWLASPPGQVKFSPDGTKFVLTMHQLGQRYPGPRYLSTYLTPHEPVAGTMDNVDVDYYRIEYEAGSGFDFELISMPTVVVGFDESRSGAEDQYLESSWYSRTVDDSFPCLFDYDDDNALIWAECFVVEHQYCAYPSSGTNHCFRSRKLVFPSGKTIEYLSEDLHDSSGDTEFLQFYHIDVKQEDCVFIRRTLTTDNYTTQKNLDNNRLDTSWMMQTGKYTIEVDMGPDPVGEEESTRVMDVLWEDGPERGQGVCSAVFNSNGNGYGGSTFSTPNTTYQAGTTPILYWQGGGAGLSPSSLPIITNVGVSGGVDYINSIILQSHKCNFLLGLPSRSAYGELDPFLRAYEAGNNAHFGTRASYAMNVSLRQSSIAPIIVPDPYVARCQVVRYEDRVMVRIANDVLPWRNLDIVYNGTHNGLPVIDTVNLNWHLVPDDAKVLVWANFDIDEAAGIVDVTDIQPFGRVG